MGNARKILGDGGITYAPSARECLKGADFCILATPWKEFKELAPSDFKNEMNQARLLDCWKLYDREKFSRELDYTSVGFYRE